MGQKKRPGKPHGGLARPDANSKSPGDVKMSSDSLPDGAVSVDALMKSECDKALIALRRGNSPKAVKIMRDATQRSSHVALGHRVNGHIHLKLANIIEDPAAKQRHFRTALESARQASILAPRSVEHANFYAQLLYEYASDSKGYDDVVKECERALAVEDPIDPRESLQELATPEARINHMQAELRNMVQKANLASLSTWMKAIGSGSDDKLRFLQVRRLTDDPMEQRVAQPKKPHEVRRSVKTQEERRQEVEVRVAAARLLQQRQQEGVPGVSPLPGGETSTDEAAKRKAGEKKKRDGDRRRAARVSPMEEKLERLKPFWQLMGRERRQELLAVLIEKLKASLTGGRGNDTNEALSEALQFAQDRKTWRFWACCKCSERFIDSGEHIQHVLSTHVGELTSRQQKMLPSDVDPDWLELLMEEDVRPIDAQAALKILIDSAQTIPAAAEPEPEPEGCRTGPPDSSSSAGGSSSGCSTCSSSEGSVDGMSSRGSSESLEKLVDAVASQDDVRAAPAPEGEEGSRGAPVPSVKDSEGGKDGTAGLSAGARGEAHKPGCNGDCHRRNSVRAGAELPHSSLPTCEDDERRKLLNRVHHLLRQFLKVKSLCMEQVMKIVQFTMDEVQGMLPDSPLHYEFNASPLYMRFLSVHQLKSILKYLMDLATSFDLDRLLRQEGQNGGAGVSPGAAPAAAAAAAAVAEEDIIQDRLLLNEEFTQLLLDERVLKEVSPEPPTFEQLEERLNAELRSLDDKEGKEGVKASEEQDGSCSGGPAGLPEEGEDGPQQGLNGAEAAEAKGPVKGEREQRSPPSEGHWADDSGQECQSAPLALAQEDAEEGPKGPGVDVVHKQESGTGDPKRVSGRPKERDGRKGKKKKKKREKHAKRKEPEVKEVALKADEMTPEKRALLEKQLADEASLRRPLPLMRPKAGAPPPLHEDLQLAWLLGRMDYELTPEKWRQQREEMARRGRELCETLKKEFAVVQGLCDKKRELCSQDDMLGHVEKLLDAEKGRRERGPDAPRKAFDDILKERTRELLEERAPLSHGRKVELDVLQTLLRESEKVKVREVPRSSMYAETLQLVARGSSDSEEDDASGRVQEAVHHRDMRIEHTIPTLREQWTIEQNQLDAKLMKALDSLAKVEAALNQTCVLDYRMPVLPLVKAFILNRIEGMAEQDALLKSNAAQEAFLAELANDEQQRVPETGAKGIKDRPKEKKKGRDRPRSKAFGTKAFSGADGAAKSDDTGLLKDEEEKSDEEPWDEEEEEAARQRLVSEQEARRLAELEAEEQKLEQALEKQRLIEEQAKLQRLAELRANHGTDGSHFGYKDGPFEAGSKGVNCAVGGWPNETSGADNCTSDEVATADGRWQQGRTTEAPEATAVRSRSSSLGSNVLLANNGLQSQGGHELPVPVPIGHGSADREGVKRDADGTPGSGFTAVGARKAAGSREAEWPAHLQQSGADGAYSLPTGPGSHSAKVHPAPVALGHKPLPPSPDQRPGFQKILRGQVPAQVLYNGESMPPIKVTPPANHRPQYVQVVPNQAVEPAATQQQQQQQQPQPQLQRRLQQPQQLPRAQAANGTGHAALKQEPSPQGPPAELQEPEPGSPRADGGSGGKEEFAAGRPRPGHTRRRRSSRSSRQAHLQGRGEGGEAELEPELAIWEGQNPQPRPPPPGPQAHVGPLPLMQPQAAPLFPAYPQVAPGYAAGQGHHGGAVYSGQGHHPPGLWYAGQSPAGHVFYAQGLPVNGHAVPQPPGGVPAYSVPGFEVERSDSPGPALQLWVPVAGSTVAGQEGVQPPQEAAFVKEGAQQESSQAPHQPHLEVATGRVPAGAHMHQQGNDAAATAEDGPQAAAPCLPQVAPGPAPASGGKAPLANGNSSHVQAGSQQDLLPSAVPPANGVVGTEAAAHRLAFVPSGHKLSAFAPSWASLAASPRVPGATTEHQPAVAGPSPDQAVSQQQQESLTGENEEAAAQPLDTPEAADERFQADLEAAISQSLDEVKRAGVVSNGLLREAPSLEDRNGSFSAVLAAPAGAAAATLPDGREEQREAREPGAGALEEAGQGLQNDVGQYNCFVNVVIQSLWHLGRFRKRMLDQSSASHVHQGDPCVVCALREIFYALNKRLKNPGREAVAPTPLRLALSAMYKQTDSFQEAQMNDASETLLVIFECLHCAFAPGAKLADSESRSDGSSSSSSCSAAPGGEWDCEAAACAAHALFGLDVKEQMHCRSCGLESRQLKYSSYFHNINASALRMAKIANEESHLDELLKMVEEHHQLPCDPDTGGCSTLNSIAHLLRAAPAVFAIVVGWQNGRESVEDISQTVDCIETEINVADIYSGLPKPHFARLVSVVCYYGQHYHCFAYNAELGQWIMFDDSTVKVVGPWEEVASTCRRGHLQPQVLFYEAPF